MDHYIDIRVEPDAELPNEALLAALFTRLHKKLATGTHPGIAASFPHHTAKNLGAVLRLHGTFVELSKMMASDWLRGVRDHVTCTPVTEVPHVQSFRTVSRVQAKSNPDRMRRRLMRRHGLTAEQAKARIPDSAAEMLDLPFLTVRSQSTGQTFRLFIRQGPIQPEPVQGTFGAYGLSPVTTIPWF
jgi:CRISPR-associated endonuclease Csy4